MPRRVRNPDASRERAVELGTPAGDPRGRGDPQGFAVAVAQPEQPGLFAPDGRRPASSRPGRGRRSDRARTRRCIDGRSVCEVTPLASRGEDSTRRVGARMLWAEKAIPLAGRLGCSRVARLTSPRQRDRAAEPRQFLSVGRAPALAPLASAGVCSRTLNDVRSAPSSDHRLVDHAKSRDPRGRQPALSEDRFQAWARASLLAARPPPHPFSAITPHFVGEPLNAVAQELVQSIYPGALW